MEEQPEQLIQEETSRQEEQEEDPQVDNKQDVQSADNDNEDASKVVYVSNLPTSVDDNEIKDYFEPFGEIKEIKILRKKQYNCIKAFITYAEAEAADKAIESKNDTLFRSSQLKVEHARRSKGYDPGTTPPEHVLRRIQARKNAAQRAEEERRYSERHNDRRYDDYGRRDDYYGRRYEDEGRYGRYDDRRYDDRRYDERRYDDRRYDDRRYDDRRYDDRRYDDRRYDDRRYDDRRYSEFDRYYEGRSQPRMSAPMSYDQDRPMP